VAWVRERTIPTERPKPVGEVGAKFADREVSSSQRWVSPTAVIAVSRPEPLLFLSNSSSVVLNEAEWTQFQTHYFSETLVAPGIEAGPLNL
jgi:hypothetical protein